MEPSWQRETAPGGASVPLWDRADGRARRAALPNVTAPPRRTQHRIDATAKRRRFIVRRKMPVYI